MIKAESLTRTYGKVVAVDNVSFQIEHGEIVGLLGHNGAGKTTIMKMLTGYIEPTNGLASINGIDVASNRLDVQKYTGYLPENCPVYPDMKVLDYLDYVATLRGVADDKKNERIVYAIEKTRLRDVAVQQVNTLSRGYRQRLGVAQAILNSPQILILDEPTNGLDPSQILEMRSLIRELAQNATVVISTHIMQEVQAVCGRVIIINRGKLALDASMNELRTSDRLVVSVDMAPEKAAELIAELPGVSIVNARVVDGQHQYTIVVDGGDAVSLAPDVARLFVERGAKLFSLQPQIRDLETIFGEITAKGNAEVVSAEKPEAVEMEPVEAAGLSSGEAADVANKASDAASETTDVVNGGSDGSSEPKDGSTELKDEGGREDA
jgi:ABC-2 type transport system ATP-binding protein